MIKTGIVGGGAAGLWAACFLKKEGASFTLLEKGPECGRKLLLTGHGRCNITNRKPVSDLMQGYHEASKFMKPALSSFTPEDVMDFVHSELGISLKEEENNRIFPVSDKASDIRDALVKYAGEENIRTDFEVVDIEYDRTAADGRFTVVEAGGAKLHFDVLIMATGGNTFPQTGSDGKSYDILEDTLGHKVTPLYPALTGIPVAPHDKEFTSSLSGVSVYAGAGLYLNNRKRNRTEGNVLFTHDGLSGPAITELARDIPENVKDQDGWIELDFTPGRDDTEVDKELLEQMRVNPDTRLVTIGADYVPQSVSHAIGRRAGVTDIKAAQITREQRKEFVKNLKHLHLTVDRQPKFETAYVTEKRPSGEPWIRCAAEPMLARR